METLLEVRNLNVFYGPVQAVFAIDLELAEGEVVALLGRNGAGKTTLLRAVMGLATVRSGEIRLRDRNVRGWSTYRLARAGLGWVPQDRGIFADLTTWENLLVAGRSRSGRPAPSPGEILELFPLLRPLRERKGGYLSGGEQQLLTIARALMSQPDILLLDEPTEGLAPVMVEAVAEQVMQLKKRGATILLAEQNLRFASRVADRGVVLQNGTLQLAGSMEECARSPEVARSLAV